MENFAESEGFFSQCRSSGRRFGPYVISAGGRTRVSKRDGLVSRQYHKHTLILTLAGHGRIKVAGGDFLCAKGDLAWLDTSKTYEHGAQLGHEWRYVWVALSGYGLDQLHETIGLLERPIVTEMGRLHPNFEAIVLMMAESHPDPDAAMNAQFSQIASELYASRLPTLVDARPDPVSKVMRHLRDDISKKWDISSLADIAGLSPSQLFRRFRAASGTSPKNWLRQERMILARHLLAATSDSINSIALRCGYGDPFHFSRDLLLEPI